MKSKILPIVTLREIVEEMGGQLKYFDDVRFDISEPAHYIEVAIQFDDQVVYSDQVVSTAYYTEYINKERIKVWQRLINYIVFKGLEKMKTE